MMSPFGRTETNNHRPIPIILKDWEEAVGIVRNVEVIENSVTISLYFSSTEDTYRVILPDRAFINNSGEFASITPGTKVGVIHVPDENVPFRLRIIEGGI